MCGIFGIYGHPEAAHLTYLGLHSLQHRGQESAGIASSDHSQIHIYRRMGLVADVFDKTSLSELRGNMAVGHVRYSTAGGSDLVNAQPLLFRHARGQMAMAHNGNLINAERLRRELEATGSIFSSNSDSEVIIHLFARTQNEKITGRITQALGQISGSYSLIFLTERKLIAARDPYGFRPLNLGKIVAPEFSQNPQSAPALAWVIASETCAFDLIGATYLRPISPGEIIVIDEKGLRSAQFLPTKRKCFCVFEHVYFARPDSFLGERSVYQSRYSFGQQLAREQPISQADLVIPVPDSGTAAALGYSAELGLPFAMGLIRSHYVGRTFIEPQQSIRHFGVKLKLSPVRALIEGKRVVVVDDSLVRGTTSRKIVTMLRNVGAKEVHLRIASPELRHPCHYGIDIPTCEELIATNRSITQIREFIGCDSLGYLSLDGMLKTLHDSPDISFCDACFSGQYPIAIDN